MAGAVEPFVVLEGVGKIYPPEREAHPIVRTLARLGGVELVGGPLDDVDEEEDLVDEQEEETGRTTGEVVALQDVSLTVDPGTCVALVGDGGAGKSVLLRIVAGLAPPTSGLVSVRGPVAPALGSLQKVAPARLGVRKMLLAIAMAARLPRARVKRSLPAIFELAGLDDAEIGLATRLTPSQLNRVLLAMMLTVDANVVLIDVPLEAGRFSERLVDRLRRRLEEGAAVLCVAEAGSPLLELADRVVHLEAGRLLFVDEETAAGAGEAADGASGAAGATTWQRTRELTGDAERYLQYLRVLVGDRAAEKAHRLADSKGQGKGDAGPLDWAAISISAGFDWTQHVAPVARLRRRAGVPGDPVGPDEPVVESRPLSPDAERYLDHLRLRVGDEQADQALRNALAFSPPEAQRIEWSWLARWVGLDAADELDVIDRLRRRDDAHRAEPIYGASQLRRRKT